MLRILFMVLMFAVTLMARENPFEPILDKESFPVSTNNPTELKPFERVDFKLSNTARAVRSIAIEYQNLDGSMGKVTKFVNQSIDWHMPLIVSHNEMERKESKFQYQSALKFANFAIKGREIKIITKTKLLRNFMLPKPHRVVLDFEKSSHFLSKFFKNQKPPFKEVRFGNHKKYYRIAIELDGQYQYKIKKTPYGHLITIK